MHRYGRPYYPKLKGVTGRRHIQKRRKHFQVVRKYTDQAVESGFTKEDLRDLLSFNHPQRDHSLPKPKANPENVPDWTTADWTEAIQKNIHGKGES